MGEGILTVLKHLEKFGFAAETNRSQCNVGSPCGRQKRSAVRNQQ